MIHLFTRLIAAIKRGILRIFPLPITLDKAIAITLFALTFCTLIGCGTQRQVTQLVRDIQRDTIYISNVKHDSVYLNHERLIDRSKDTVYIKDVSVEYKYRLLRDTIKVVQQDSIPYEVTVIETKEITRPLTVFDYICRFCFIFIISVLFVGFVRFVVKLKNRVL